MKKLTGKEIVTLFALSMLGTSATSLVAWYYPDYPDKITLAGVVSVALLVAVGVLIIRKKAT